MKSVKRLILVLLIFLGSGTILLAATQDKINVFLQEFIDGKPTGQFIHFELTIYSGSEKEGNKWLLSEETFSTIEDQKFTTVNLTQSRSNDDYSTPVISGVKWIPGKEFQCTYGPFGGGMDLELKANKGSTSKYDWIVSCAGTYKLTASDATHKWEFKSTRELTLEFNKLRFQNLYYRK